MKGRVLIFHEQGFPFIDTVEIDSKKLIEALPPVDSVRTVGIEDLKKELSEGRCNLLVNPYGSAFPKAAWPEILAYLKSGGCILNLGGAPFSVPVRRDGDSWRQEMRQTAYHRELGINQVYPVSTNSVTSYETLETEPLLSGLIDEFSCRLVYELQVRLTSKPDHPGQIGSSGAREAIIRPLIHGLDSNGRRIVAPIIALDRIFGRFAGGRWVFANFTADSMPRKEIITRLAGFALIGAHEFEIRPSFACYYPEERAALVVHANRFKDSKDETSKLSLFLTVRKENITILQENLDISDFRSPYYLVVPLKVPLSPGVYTVQARLSTGNAELTDKYADYYTTGFWCYDSALVKMTQPLTAGKDYFMRGDKPSPLVGTTYMASDVHRKFLLEPNVAVWERDFAEMKAAGINIVRTGLWTTFRHVMLDPGAPNEGAMRAVTAFMLTAAKYEMPVIFTLFTFAPEAFEGENPYLDPRSLQGQQEFVSAFAKRLAPFNNVMWDLINEPSIPGHGRFWRSRPNHDKWEEQAWKKWIEERHPDKEELTEKWRLTCGSSISLPSLEDFEDKFVYRGEGHLRVLDYRLFAQDIFNNWVRIMTNCIRANGNPKQLITVGQDEGGASERPNPQFHWKEVDFTSTHTWWLNDDLLWSGLTSKVPEKPSVVEETGIMHIEEPGRTARRTEEDCRNLLERKLVMAFASGCAGFIEWIWNTNIYMPDDNEAAIGFHRADLTAKPELEIIPRIKDFVVKARQYMIGREIEPVVMVIPYSSMYSVRDLASSAVRMAVRVMHYHCGVPMRVVGEYSLENLGKPRLIILPSPRVLSNQAWEKLIRAVEEGAVMLVTGPIEWDEYRRPTERLSRIGIHTETQPVSREERIIILGDEFRLSFGGEKIHRVDKAVVSGQANIIKNETIGAGKLIFASLPFELADNSEPLAALYSFALKQAAVISPFKIETEALDPGVLIRPLLFKEAILYTIVSETNMDRQFDLTDMQSGKTLKVRVPSQRAVMFLIDRIRGQILAEYGCSVEG
ncbi:MAG: hypothetical protein QHH26_02895 [Armatimonadota bacterium]|nr:hypothetical protein [Armatimonadota bacterium]